MEVSPMSGYTKLFSSIVASTIWREDDATRLVWVTMLAMVSKDGIVEASAPGLADMARVPVEECRKSLAKLEGPDPDSRSKNDEGRRIRPVDGGWEIINYYKYRERLMSDERRQYWKEYKQKKRSCPQSPQLSTVPSASASSSVSERSEDIPPASERSEDRIAKKQKVKEDLILPEIPPRFKLSQKFCSMWNDWIAQGKERKKSPVTSRALKMQMKMLEEMGLSRAKYALRNSIANQYQGIYEPSEMAVKAALAKETDEQRFERLSEEESDGKSIEQLRSGFEADCARGWVSPQVYIARLAALASRKAEVEYYVALGYSPPTAGEVEAERRYMTAYSRMTPSQKAEEDAARRLAYEATHSTDGPSDLELFEEGTA